MAYIGIDRGIEDHWIYQDAEYFKVWFEILLRTRYSKEPEKKLMDGKFVTIEYGQFMYGRISWSDRLRVSEQRMRTLFKKMIDDDMIELIQKFPRFSLYSVKNYAKYHQHINQHKDETGKGFSDDDNQQSNGTPTTIQPAANQQLTTQEERKKDNKYLSISGGGGANMYAMYSREIGDLTQSVSQRLIMLEEDYTEEWVKRSIENAVFADVKTMKYIEGTLKKWMALNHPEPWTVERQTQQQNLRQFPKQTQYPSHQKHVMPVANGKTNVTMTPEELEHVRSFGRGLTDKGFDAS